MFQLLSEIVEVEENKDELQQTANNNKSKQQGEYEQHQPGNKKERKLRKSGTNGNKRRSLSLPTGIKDVNFSPNDKFLDFSKLEAFADKINGNEKLKIVLERAVNIVGKGENAGYPHFLLFPMFSKEFLFRVVKSRDCMLSPRHFQRKEGLTLSQTTKFRLFADDNFKFDENARILSIWVGNTEGKGETAHYEQFLLFPKCSQKIYTADT